MTLRGHNSTYCNSQVQNSRKGNISGSRNWADGGETRLDPLPTPTLVGDPQDNQACTLLLVASPGGGDRWLEAWTWWAPLAAWRDTLPAQAAGTRTTRSRGRGPPNGDAVGCGWEKGFALEPETTDPTQVPTHPRIGGPVVLLWLPELRGPDASLHLKAPQTRLVLHPWLVGPP